MTAGRYYQDELRYLRELGREFAQDNPEVAPLLLEAGADPSVERLLEGFAFLTARIREKLDDELPEFTGALLESLMPHFLRPVPALTILQFSPLPKAFAELPQVPRGAVIDSAPVDGTRCRFTTTAAVQVVPLKVESVALRNEAPPRLIIRFSLLQGGNVARLGLKKLRLHLAGDEVVARQLLACLAGYLRELRVEVETGSERRSQALPAGSLRLAGFGADEAVLADDRTGHGGFNALHEYFAFPEKFHFVDIDHLDTVPLLATSGQFSLVAILDRLPTGMPTPTTDNIQLNCVPAVNLFSHTADPLSVDQQTIEQRVRPAGKERTHYEIHEVTGVTALGPDGRVRRFDPLFHYPSRMGLTQDFYSIRQRRTDDRHRGEHWISLIQSGRKGAPSEALTLSLDLRCTNADLPTALAAGDISTGADGVPPTVRVRNLTRPSASIPIPTGDDLHWRLLGHLQADFSSLANLETLRGLLATYHFSARTNRKDQQSFRRLLDGIRALTSRPEKRLLDGAMIGGVAVELTLDEDHFPSTGDLYLFASVLDQLFSQFVSLNAFSRLTVRGARYGETFTWPVRLGHRHLL